MREISFQGRSFDGTWYEGNLVKHGNQAHIVYYDHLGIEHWHEVDEVTVCQFTGLHDKYGTKIYEGDIVELYNREDFRAEVIFQQSCFCLRWFDRKIMSRRQLSKGIEPIVHNINIIGEVIGNIYEGGE